MFLGFMVRWAVGLLLQVALSLLNTPYIYGGKNPNTGLDCSGLACVILHAFGLDKGIPSVSSQGLFNWFSHPERHGSRNPQLGALAFYGNSIFSIDHCGVCLSPLRMIEAGGGDHTVTTFEIAAAKNAYVKVTPIYRAHLIGTFLPHYDELPTP